MAFQSDFFGADRSDSYVIFKECGLTLTRGMVNSLGCCLSAATWGYFLLLLLSGTPHTVV